MKCAIYGANLSGYYAVEILKLQSYECIFFIDQNPKNKHIQINNDIPIYKSMDEVPEKLKQEIDMIMIALGNKDIAMKKKMEFEGEYSFKVYCIHEEPYEFFNNIFKKFNEKITYLVEEGFYRSFEDNQSVDFQGNAIPWINYTLFDLLKKRVSDQFTVFEYGSGHSTIWWSAHTKYVIAIENNKEWYKYVSGKVNKKNTKLIFKELEYDGEYCRSINDFENIDIVFIDGRDRVNCAIQAVNSLNHTGVIIWDDTEREYYNKGFEYLKNKGFKCLKLKGMKALADYASYTSIFYRDENCLGL